MPATKHMANHLTRVPKLSVEASRTLIRREEKEDITHAVQNNLKDNFFSTTEALNFKQNNFQPEIIILPCLTVICVLILSYHKIILSIWNIWKHIYKQTKKTKPIKVQPGMQATLEVVSNRFFLITTQLKIVTVVSNQKNEWNFQQFAKE